MISFLNLLHQLGQESCSFPGSSPWASDYSVSSGVGRCFFPVQPAFPRAQYLLHHMERQSGALVALALLSPSLYTAEARTVGTMLCANLLPWGLEPRAAGWSRILALNFQGLEALERPGKLISYSFVFPSFGKENFKFFASQCGYDPERWARRESDCCL